LPVVTDTVARTAAGAVHVRNEGDRSLAVRLTVADFTQSEDGRHAFLPAGSDPRGCGPDIRVTPEAASIPAGASEQIRFHVAGAPADRSCWFLLFVEHPAPSGSGVLIRQRIGVKVFAVPPGAAPGGEIAAGEVSDTGEARSLSFRYRNPGDAPARPSGSVEVRDFRGGLVATSQVRGFTVLPESARRVEVELPAGLAPGRYLAVPVLDFGGEYLAGAQFPFRVP
ncbi:MAG: hypothetical protein RRA92_03410, partial [Gemmatimonadota bacterium]|nr:hypothetical protein [Gemmatimonadota bacterium]